MRKGEKRTLIILGSVFALCVVATLFLLFAGRDGDDEPKEKTYYLTRYDTPEELVLVSVENRTGSVLLAMSGDTCYVQGDLPLDANKEAVRSLFETACRLPMKRLLEGADSSDPQYGLTDPEAEILLQDTSEGGVLFRIGASTPDREGYYACLVGDARVFVMANSDAQAFLTETDRFYDLRLNRKWDDAFRADIKCITVTRDGKTAYSVEASGDTGDAMLFSMKEPFAVPLEPGRVKDVLFMPLSSLSGIEVIRNVQNESALGFSGPDNSFTVTLTDGSEMRILIGKQDGVKTIVKREEDGLVMTVPTANLSFYFGSATDVVGDALINAPLGNLNRLVIDKHVYEFGGTPPELTVTLDGKKLALEAFQNGVYTALSRISILGEWDGSSADGKPVLTISVQCTYGKKPAPEVTYAFYELTGNRYGVSVDGQPAFLCSRSAAEAVIID